MCWSNHGPDAAELTGQSDGASKVARGGCAALRFWPIRVSRRRCPSPWGLRGLAVAASSAPTLVSWGTLVGVRSRGGWGSSGAVCVSVRQPTPVAILAEPGTGAVRSVRPLLIEAHRQRVKPLDHAGQVTIGKPKVVQLHELLVWK
jgi:hypothetical protein